MTDYSKLNMQLALSNILDDDETILYGFAIRQEDETGFLMDLEALVRRYGGVPFDELLECDLGDESGTAAIRASMVQGKRIDDTIEVEPLSHKTGDFSRLEG